LWARFRISVWLIRQLPIRKPRISKQSFVPLPQTSNTLPNHFAVLTSGLQRLVTLPALLSDAVLTKSLRSLPDRLDGVLAWGQRPSSVKPARLAHKFDLPLLRVEDGFLRSYGTGQTVPTLSLVLDDAGIYYDSTCPSALESLLASSQDMLSGQETLVDRALRVLLEKGLSKYNHAPDGKDDLNRNFTPCNNPRNSSSGLQVRRILVIDQTLGDMSVSLGGATDQTFLDMLVAAKAENPNATIFVKTHPEVSLGRKGGYLTQVQPDDRTVILQDMVNPMSLLPHMNKVYVVTSTMGFEALLMGKPVVCFGVPWYAGWGLTDDRCKNSPAWARRTRKRSVRELFAAAYIHYTRYLNPLTHQRGGILDVIDWLVRQKEMANRMHGDQRQGRVLAVGFSRWKSANIKLMLGLQQDLVGFLPNLSALSASLLKPGDTVVCWGAKPPQGLADYVQSCWARLIHVEDGFVRSVGLGSDLIRPQSIVLDERGIYFDATRPSDLEVMLATRTFSDEDLARAKKVRAFIVQHDITKYNIEMRDPASWGAAEQATGRTVVLVPGQVEDDASILLGCTTVRTNLELLHAVRKALPSAFIVYKPHPDVASGNRKGRVSLHAAGQWADHIETSLGVVSCIDAVDEVHTMTSLTGFDALLRGKKVVTYGQPFYAGWGLTDDRAEFASAFERRTRRLSLDELIAGTLLHYPIYWDWTLKGYTTCEAVLHRVVEERTKLEINGNLSKLRVGVVRRNLRKLKIIFTSMFV